MGRAGPEPVRGVDAIRGSAGHQGPRRQRRGTS